MKRANIARALKDKAYFNSLSEEEKQLVRDASPTGAVELTDDDLVVVAGGRAIAGSGSGSGSGSGGGGFRSCDCTCTCNCAADS